MMPGNTCRRWLLRVLVPLSLRVVLTQRLEDSENQEEWKMPMTLKELEEHLPMSQFMRVHKSYIIALKQISSMENNELVLKKNQNRIPLGNNYKEAFLEKMKSKLMQ